MMKWRYIACILILTSIGCKSTKSAEDIKPLSWVLTLTDESDVNYINEKYSKNNFVCSSRMSKTGYRYRCDYTGPRTKALDLKKALLEESQVQDVSNYIVKGNAEDVEAYKAKKAQAIKK